jgi:hypothetical protein
VGSRPAIEVHVELVGNDMRINLLLCKQLFRGAGGGEVSGGGTHYM